jgi:hypothetical protein
MLDSLSPTNKSVQGDTQDREMEKRKQKSADIQSSFESKNDASQRLLSKQQKQSKKNSCCCKVFSFSPLPLSAHALLSHLIDLQALHIHINTHPHGWRKKNFIED